MRAQFFLLPVVCFASFPFATKTTSSIGISDYAKVTYIFSVSILLLWHAARICYLLFPTG